ncbi:MAG: GntR family transcriptional regulator [Anaerolineales bacterium]|jgi:GntR family transcriptional regulator
MNDITNTEGIPLYIKIRESLRERILSGELERGQRLPAEEELATQFGVSRMTVRQGISDLINDGLMYRRHGVGTFVSFPHIERDHSRLTNFFDNSNLQGIKAEANILNVTVIPAKPRIAKALMISRQDPVINIETLRKADHVPVTLHDAYFPQYLFPDLAGGNAEPLDVQNLWTKFEQYGYPVNRAVQKLEARLADQDLATILKIQPGAPILYKERTVYANDGTPVEFTYCYNRGDMYSLTVTLNR